MHYIGASFTPTLWLHHCTSSKCYAIVAPRLPRILRLYNFPDFACVCGACRQNRINCQQQQAAAVAFSVDTQKFSEHLNFNAVAHAFLIFSVTLSQSRYCLAKINLRISRKRFLIDWIGVGQKYCVRLTLAVHQLNTVLRIARNWSKLWEFRRRNAYDQLN